MKKWWPVLLLIPVAWAVLGCVAIALRMHWNDTARQTILAALEEQYPSARFRTAFSYESPMVYVSVYGVKDVAERSALVEWLAQLKAERRLGVEIQVRFDDEFDREETIR